MVAGTGPAGPPVGWIGTADACRRLGVTLRTLYRLIDEGDLRAETVGRVVRVRAVDVEALAGWMHRRRRDGGDPPVH